MKKGKHNNQWPYLEPRAQDGVFNPLLLNVVKWSDTL